jgi:hypothetical protein
MKDLTQEGVRALVSDLGVLLSWFESRPENEKYMVKSAMSCPVACYLREQGVEDPHVGTQEIHFVFSTGEAVLLDSPDHIVALVRRIDLPRARRSLISAADVVSEIRALLARGGTP